MLEKGLLNGERGEGVGEVKTELRHIIVRSAHTLILLFTVPVRLLHLSHPKFELNFTLSLLFFKGTHIFCDFITHLVISEHFCLMPSFLLKMQPICEVFYIFFQIFHVLLPQCFGGFIMLGSDWAFLGRISAQLRLTFFFLKFVTLLRARSNNSLRL